MRKPRWLAPWKDSQTKPVIYHVVSRVVDRRFILEADEKNHFRMLMRVMENFTGCRVLSYCFMTNHFHILLEVPPLPEGGLSDQELTEHLDHLYSKAFVKQAREELDRDRISAEEAQRSLAEGKISRKACERAVDRYEKLRSKHLNRLHSLSEFMKGLLQRFTSWYNRHNGRKGGLWENRYRSVIVEDGFACRVMAAYIDLNPVRAGMVDDPADYPWSSYGEAVSGGKKARVGLVRALTANDLRDAQAKGEKDQEAGLFDFSKAVRQWGQGGLGKEYRAILLRGAHEVYEQGPTRQDDDPSSKTRKRRGMSRKKTEAELAQLQKSDSPHALSIAKVISARVRHFTDGAVIGSEEFVDEVFEGSRDYFGPKRATGARKPRGPLSELKGILWTARDLQAGVDSA